LELVGHETGKFTPAERAPTAFNLALLGYELQGQLGQGGMGIVFRAWRQNLHREVAVKVLRPGLASNPRLLERFRNEADLAGRLTNAHILPVFDVLEARGVPVIVSPLIEGADLGQILRDRAAARDGRARAGAHPWAALEDREYLDRVLPLLDQLVEAVTALHQAEILHRDIKPSNLLVDRERNGWLSDFGVARFEGQSLGTEPGVVVGTRGYVSPEQARGEEIDRRADLFSLGVTLYEALTLELPFGRAGVQERARPPVRPSIRRPLLPRQMDAVLLKALAVDREERFASAADLQEQWHRARQLLAPRKAFRQGRRRTLAAALALLAALGLGTIALFARHLGPTAPPAHGTPADEPAHAATPSVTRAVHIETTPVGAKVAMVPVDPDTGALLAQRVIRPPGRTPLTISQVPAGEYLVVVEAPGHGFHEVLPHRSNPGSLMTEFAHQRALEAEDGTVHLPRISIPGPTISDRMSPFSGGDFSLGREDLAGAPPYRVMLRPYFLDTTEVTVAAYRALMNGLPKGMPGDAPAACAVAWVTYDSAVQYAELAGKRLPEEAEYEFAATRGGTSRFPWGRERRFPPWHLGTVREPYYDQTPTAVPVFGLFSNVAEWTTSWPYPYPGSKDAKALAGRLFPEFGAKVRSSRVVRGGPLSVVSGKPDASDPSTAMEWDPRWRLGMPKETKLPGLGFRCARSARPRYLDD
jgi:formylglycine-generating enzyme required for sulfatase activity